MALRLVEELNRDADRRGHVCGRSGRGRGGGRKVIGLAERVVIGVCSLGGKLDVVVAAATESLGERDRVLTQRAGVLAWQL